MQLITVAVLSLATGNSGTRSRSPFSITDAIIGTGTKFALRTKVLANSWGELLQVVSDSGGKTARLKLASPSTGRLREVLVPLTDAAAIRDTANGIHYAGSILAPFANRVANGSYNFFGQRYLLPRNECPPGVRCDALHGFLFNRSMEVLRQDVLVDLPGHRQGARLVLGYDFDGVSTPGWPFRARVNVTYLLTSHEDGPSHAAPSVLSITVRAANLEPGPVAQALPFTASWHPYFQVSDVSAATIKFGSCDGGGWRHLQVGPGGPRGGDLIPTGRSQAWSKFDGSHPIGGNRTHPTYYDDEFTSTLPTPVPCSVRTGDGVLRPNSISHSISDGAGTVSLAGQGLAAHTWQLFTGAREGWGWDAIALEPMAGLADAYNNGADLSVLQPGELFEASFHVQIA